MRKKSINNKNKEESILDYTYIMSVVIKIYG